MVGVGCGCSCGMVTVCKFGILERNVMGCLLERERLREEEEEYDVDGSRCDAELVYEWREPC